MLFKPFFLASTASATCLHGLSMFKRSEGEVGVFNKFGYAPLNGPFNWAALSPQNEACKAGLNQSPINIDASISLATEKPILHVPEVDQVEFLNLGTTIEVVVNGTTSFAGSDYRLVQFHVHTPSEHHVNNEYHPLEVHMVHQGVTDQTKLAVIALMFQVSTGESSSIIKSFSKSLSKISEPGSKVFIPGGIDFTDVTCKIASSDILQYSGSLTTPPCAEGVTFLIVKDPLDISVADFNKIKSIVKFNSRFIQTAPGEGNILNLVVEKGTPAAEMVLPVSNNPSYLHRRQNVATQSVMGTPAPLWVKRQVTPSPKALTFEPTLTPTPTAEDTPFLRLKRQVTPSPAAPTAENTAKPNPGGGKKKHGDKRVILARDGLERPRPQKSGYGEIFTRRSH